MQTASMRSPARSSVRLLLWAGVAAALAAPAWCADPPDLTTIGIEAVMNLEVTSVSKKPERLMNAAAGIQVITSDDIQRSGATSIPDLLRLVPGVQVSQSNSSTWAIGVRGFASTLSRSLLVLIDGRSVYSTLFAGVYWDVQDMLLDDIDRIEVIRGPGATLWGANAVNGVINIITKSARRTQGGYTSLVGGNEDRVIAGARYGGQTSGGLAWRAYAKYFDRDAEFHANGNDFDGWHMGRIGFRADSDQGARDRFTVQGDYYDGRAGQRTGITSYTSPYFAVLQQDSELSGGNLLGHWSHTLREGSETELRAYYDSTHRALPNFRENRDTLDVEFRHRLLMGRRQELVWGAGYRVSRGDAAGVPTLEFLPPSRTDEVFNAFAQDEIRLVPSRWLLTVGSKIEHNDYSGVEYQPSVRLAFTPSSRQTFWAAASRALRIPSRIEQDLTLTALVDPTTPVFARLIGSKDFAPERLMAYEAGYRLQATKKLFLDLTIFDNDYAHLLSIEPGTPFTEPTPAPSHTVIPYMFKNEMLAGVHGAEIAWDWKPIDRWKLTGSYSYLHINETRESDSLDTTTEAGTEGSSPRHMASLRSSLDLPRAFGLEVIVRYVDALPSQRVPAYTEMDFSLRRRLKHGLELSLVGQNLLEPHHLEFAGGPAGIEIERSGYLRLVGRW